MTVFAISRACYGREPLRRLMATRKGVVELQEVRGAQSAGCMTGDGRASRHRFLRADRNSARRPGRRDPHRDGRARPPENDRSRMTLHGLSKTYMLPLHEPDGSTRIVQEESLRKTQTRCCF
jgi:hypothetical protein